MLNIDLRSILLLAAIMGMLMTAVVFLLRRSFPPSIKGLSGWAGGTALAFIAALLIAARGKLPDLLSLPIANLLLLSGIVFMYLSLRRLLGLEVAIRPWGILLAAVAPVLMWLGYIDLNIEIFRIFTSALPAIPFISMIGVLWKHGGTTLSARLLLIALLLHTSVIALYLCYHWFVLEPGRSLFDATPIQTFYLLSYALTFLVLNIGFILRVSDQLRSQLEQSIAEHLKTEYELQRHRDNLQQMVIEQTADLIQAKEAAEAASHTKSEFLASMSHELRTPLNAVLGYAQLLEMDASLPAETKGQVKEIELAGRHLLDLVNDLIDLARIEAGKLAFSPGPVDIQSLVSDSLSIVKPVADKHGIKLVMASDVPDNLTVHADSARLGQVMINLLTNAIKYNRPDGTVQLSFLAHDGKLRMSVSDRGRGIPAEMQNRLFTAFDRLGKECGPVEGTGIGLIISKRLVEAMGGIMGFESIPEQGSTFWVEFAATAT